MITLEDSSRLSGIGFGAVLVALGVALQPMSYVGFLGLPLLGVGWVLMVVSAIGIRDPQTEQAPGWAGLALIVVGASLVALFAWELVIDFPARPGSAPPPGAGTFWGDTLAVVVAAALFVAGLRLRMPFTALGIAGLFALALAAAPVATGFSALFVNLWAPSE